MFDDNASMEWLFNEGRGADNTQLLLNEDGAGR